MDRPMKWLNFPMVVFITVFVCYGFSLPVQPNTTDVNKCVILDAVTDESTCGPGQFLYILGDGSMHCNACLPHTFQQFHSKCTSCNPCQVCGENEVYLSECNATQDAVCVAKTTEAAAVLSPVSTTAQTAAVSSSGSTTAHSTAVSSTTPQITEDQHSTQAQRILEAKVTGQVEDEHLEVIITHRVVICVLVVIILILIFTLVQYWRKRKEKIQHQINPNTQHEMTVLQNGTARHTVPDGVDAALLAENPPAAVPPEEHLTEEGR